MAGIAFFDIDGTLTYGISSGAFIADRLGTGDRMRDAEDRYARGEIGNDRYAILMLVDTLAIG